MDVNYLFTTVNYLLTNVNYKYTVVIKSTDNTTFKPRRKTMILIFALMITAALATIATLGCVFFVVNKIQKAIARPMYLIKRQLLWKLA